jgi:hypothetical protein
LWQKTVRWLAHLGWHVVLEQRQRRAIRQLEALDDRMLGDIGLSRGEIESAARGARCGERGCSAKKQVTCDGCCNLSPTPHSHRQRAGIQNSAFVSHAIGRKVGLNHACTREVPMRNSDSENLCPSLLRFWRNCYFRPFMIGVLLGLSSLAAGAASSERFYSERSGISVVAPGLHSGGGNLVLVW